MNLVLEFESLAALEAEVEANLGKGRAFVPGVGGAAQRQAGELTLVHPDTGGRMTLAVEAVYVQEDGPTPGIGVQLLGHGTEQVVALEQFVSFGAEGIQPLPIEPTIRGAGGLNNGDGGQDLPPPSSAAPGDASQEDEVSRDLDPLRRRVTTIHEKVRGYSSREREIAARTGRLTERIALERAYGSAVWELLLQNPGLTGPEVAKIAKNGNLPTPLLGVIVSNASWLAKGEVRRALLANRRLSGHNLRRVLAATPAGELRQIPQQTAYGANVRAAAKELLNK